MADPRLEPSRSDLISLEGEQGCSIMPSEQSKRRAQQKARRQAQREERKQAYRPTLSPVTRQRLYDEAMNSCAFEGMTPEEIRSEVDQLLTRYLDQLPWWYGKTASADA